MIIFDLSTISYSDHFLSDDHLDVLDLGLTHGGIDVASDVEHLPVLDVSHV